MVVVSYWLGRGPKISLPMRTMVAPPAIAASKSADMPIERVSASGYWGFSWANCLATCSKIVLSGCSAGGMACYLHCDYVAEYFSSNDIPVKCVCDAGMFLDVDTVTGAGNVMEKRYFDIADNMESKPGLSKTCIDSETDWRKCMFSQTSLKYVKTPTFVYNSLYNFGEWAMLAPDWNDTGVPPPDWAQCWYE